MRRTAHCPCGGKLAFATDRIGRTVEQCASCGYEGLVRRTGRIAVTAETFPCGHSRAAPNVSHNLRGFDQCRECGRRRAAASRQHQKRDAAPRSAPRIQTYVPVVRASAVRDSAAAMPSEVTP